MKLLAKPINFIKEVKAQLIKVSWPTRQELIAATLVVIAAIIITSIFVGFVDLILSRILSWIFR